VKKKKEGKKTKSVGCEYTTTIPKKRHSKGEGGGKSQVEREKKKPG